MHGGAHPRAYGENPAPISARTQSGGSSPRIRGKRTLRIYNIGRAGLIPAHTGKTPMRWLGDFHIWAHPRAYGENAVGELGSGKSAGSSPRIRGKPRRLNKSGRPSGLIPAHTGKTSNPRVAGTRTWAHPRAYGENCTCTADEAAELGSSPRIRGKRFKVEVCGRSIGLIPAHTGKTRQ